jgi:hypothetical protein
MAQGGREVVQMHGLSSAGRYLSYPSSSRAVAGGRLRPGLTSSPVTLVRMTCIDPENPLPVELRLGGGRTGVLGVFQGDVLKGHIDSIPRSIAPSFAYIRSGRNESLLCVPGSVSSPWGPRGFSYPVATAVGSDRRGGRCRKAGRLERMVVSGG